MRQPMAFAVVLLTLSPAVAQEGVIEAGTLLRIPFRPAGSLRFTPAYVLVEESGAVELETLGKGLGRVKLAGLTIEQAMATLSDRLRIQDIKLMGRPASVDPSKLGDLLKAEQKSEKDFARRIDVGLGYLDMLRTSLEKIPEDDEEQHQVIKPGSVVRITFKKLIPTAQLGIGKDYLVGDDGPFELKLGTQSFGRVGLIGKTADEAQAAITKHLQVDDADAEAELQLFSVTQVKEALARSEKQVAEMRALLGVLRQNIETLKRSLPVN